MYITEKLNYIVLFPFLLPLDYFFFFAIFLKEEVEGSLCNRKGKKKRESERQVKRNQTLTNLSAFVRDFVYD